MKRGPSVDELTPSGRGGVSVLAVRGEGALEAVRQLVPRAALRVGEPVLARLELEGCALDEVIVCLRSTDEIELHAHGSPALLSELRRVLSVPPAARAAARTAGELAAASLPSAVCESGARILLDQAEGALARELATMHGLERAQLAQRLAELAARSEAARFAIEPATVVLAGPVNAGKSTLFNLLVGSRRATVSETAGTTRDALRERVLLGRYPIDLIDTAGERALGGEGLVEEVERAAQSLAHEWGRRGSLVLWLSPPGEERAVPRPGAGRVVVLASRIDQLEPAARPPGGISALAAPAAARARVEASFHAAFDLPADPWQPGRGVVLGADAKSRLERLELSVRRGQVPTASIARELDALLRVDDVAPSRAADGGERG